MQQGQRRHRATDLRPQPVAIQIKHALEIHQTEGAEAPETITDGHIGQRSDLDEADQHPDEKNFHHAPGQQQKEPAADGNTQRG